MKKTKKGFTLVELMVVIAILAILATVSVVGYTSFIKKANKSNAVTELKEVATFVSAETATGDPFYVGDPAKVALLKSAPAAEDATGFDVVEFTSKTVKVVKFTAVTENSKLVWKSADQTTTDITAFLKNVDEFKDLDGTFTADSTKNEVTFTKGEGTSAVSATWTLGTFEVK